MGKFDALIKKLNIDETYTKPIREKVKYDSVKENTLYGVPDFNFMADTLHLPETKEGFRFLLVIVDLGTNEFDIEPLKGNSKSTITDIEALKAMETIFKRKWLKKPEGSIRVDSGNEFKGAFQKYCYDNNILIRRALPGRHKQLANIDALCNQLGRLFNGYMNHKEQQTRRVYKEWTDILETVREDLNNIRKVKKHITPFEVPLSHVVLTDNKYKVGDKVFRKLEKPKDALGKNQPTSNFRTGDFRYELKPREIIRVLPYPTQFRYLLQGVKNCSYTEAELKPAQDIQAPKQYDTKGREVYSIKDIIGKKIIKKQIHYKIWFEGEKKSESQWISEKDLIEDGLQDELEDYNENN